MDALKPTIRAYDTACSLPLERFAPAPYLKLSGIVAILGEVLEADGRPEQAYEIFVAGLSHLQSHWPELTGKERLRGVALAHKVGEMTETYQLGKDEEEKWLTWAAQEALRITKGDSNVKEENGESVSMMLTELDLPKWVNIVDIAAPIEALGAFYAKMQNTECVQNLIFRKGY